jgi:hypothetical protein
MRPAIHGSKVDAQTRCVDGVASSGEPDRDAADDGASPSPATFHQCPSIKSVDDAASLSIKMPTQMLLRSTAKLSAAKSPVRCLKSRRRRDGVIRIVRPRLSTDEVFVTPDFNGHGVIRHQNVWRAIRRPVSRQVPQMSCLEFCRLRPRNEMCKYQPMCVPPGPS